jgi:cytoskeletal protein RodZ
MTPLITVTTIFVGICVVAAIAIWQRHVTARARLAAEESQSYKESAQQAAEETRKTNAELAMIRTRLEAIEKILGEVG